MAMRYKPRPERWPQFTLRGMLVLTTLSCVLSATVLAKAVEAYLARRSTHYATIDLDTLCAPCYSNCGDPIAPPPYGASVQKYKPIADYSTPLFP